MGDALEADQEVARGGPDKVLHLELAEGGHEAALLYGARVPAGGEVGEGFRLGPRDDHLARGEDEGGGAGITDPHDEGVELLAVIFNIAGVLGDDRQVEPTSQVDCCHDVLDLGGGPLGLNTFSPRFLGRATLLDTQTSRAGLYISGHIRRRVYFSGLCES